MNPSDYSQFFECAQRAIKVFRFHFDATELVSEAYISFNHDQAFEKKKFEAHIYSVAKRIKFQRVNEHRSFHPSSITICSKCSEQKDSSEFPIINQKGLPPFRSNVCRACVNKRALPSIKKYQNVSRNKIRILKRDKMRRDTTELKDAYIKHSLRRKYSAAYLDEHYDIIETQRFRLLLKRGLKREPPANKPIRRIPEEAR